MQVLIGHASDSEKKKVFGQGSLYPTVSLRFRHRFLSIPLIWNRCRAWVCLDNKKIKVVPEVAISNRRSSITSTLTVTFHMESKGDMFESGWVTEEEAEEEQENRQEEDGESGKDEKGEYRQDDEGEPDQNTEGAPLQDEAGDSSQDDVDWDDDEQRKRWRSWLYRSESEESYSTGSDPDETSSEWDTVMSNSEDEQQDLDRRRRRRVERQWMSARRGERHDRQEEERAQQDETVSEPKPRHGRTDLRGLLEENPQLGVKLDTPPKQFASYLMEKHLCKLCERSPMDRALRSPGKRYTLCDGWSELRERAKSCKTYMVVLSCLEPYNHLLLSRIKVFAKRVSLTIESESTRPRGTRLRRVFVDLGRWSSPILKNRISPKRKDIQAEKPQSGTWKENFQSCHKP